MTKTRTLFPDQLPTRKWIEFQAEGYSTPVSGAIFTSNEPPCCGMPLGGISTGCLDIDPRGTFGYSSIFNPESEHSEWKGWRDPRRWPEIQPFLGLSVANQTWVLANAGIASGESIDWCTEPQMQVKEDGIHLTPAFHLQTQALEGVSFAQKIEYWGHYPVADMAFETGSPVKVELRSWTPFIPGDLAASNVPAAIFEVLLHNPGKEQQSGRLAFSFAGPNAQEARSLEFTRREIHEDFQGMLVSSTSGVQYLLGVLSSQAAFTTPSHKNGKVLTQVNFGMGLHKVPPGWAQMAKGLPQSSSREERGEIYYDDGSCSVACGFALEPGSSQTVRFVLTWYAPVVKGATKTWEGIETAGDGIHMKTRWAGSDWEGKVHHYLHMYATRFKDAVDVARYLVTNHASRKKPARLVEGCVD
jgi:uncharacterized protein (DUF608 family)